MSCVASRLHSCVLSTIRAVGGRFLPPFVMLRGWVVRPQTWFIPSSFSVRAVPWRFRSPNMTASRRRR
jgi:hypothetical protein